ncbi:MAG TPA: BlaI/MecI/CopY family transcriptional regulator [Kofleriaceae bacterium]|jgi:predicted transcriptional regulator
MAPKRGAPGGALEYAVMAAVWELGSASAPEVHERCGQADGLAYTTTAKVLDRLFAKKLVVRGRVGRSFVYRAAVPREVIDRERTTTALTTLFGNEPRPAIATLVDAVEAIDPDLLDDMARELRKRRSRRGA